MELRFVRTWKSIDELVVGEAVEDLVVLSGPNGSGKSQLLEAIHHGTIAIDGVSGGQVGQPQAGIRFFALAKSDPGVQPLTDDEFVSRYGPPPWNLLDETLKLIGLEYHFDPPVGTEDDLPCFLQSCVSASIVRCRSNSLLQAKVVTAATQLSDTW